MLLLSMQAWLLLGMFDTTINIFQPENDFGQRPFFYF